MPADRRPAPQPPSVGRCVGALVAGLLLVLFVLASAGMLYGVAKVRAHVGGGVRAVCVWGARCVREVGGIRALPATGDICKTPLLPCRAPTTHA